MIILNRSIVSFLRGLMTAAILILPVGALAQSGGRATLVSGPVSVISAKGESRLLQRGDRVETSDIVVTGDNANAHLVMDDHALIALRPNSKLIIESYLAEGGVEDRSKLELTKGFMRAVTGWIGKTAPRNYKVRTPSATIGIRGTDHEVGVLEGGEAAGTYSKVNEGGTRLTNAAGDIDIGAGRAGFVASGRPAAPRALDRIPPEFKPSPFEKQLEIEKSALAESVDRELELRRMRQNEKVTSSLDCGPDNSAIKAMRAFIESYEAGDLGAIQSRLDPAMPGYQRFIDSLMRDFAIQKQIRIFVKDMTAQCGPDLVNLTLTWEKRFLDLLTFQPGFFKGQVSILMQRDGANWRPSAFAGDNPFARTSGTLSRFSFGPNFSLNGIGQAPMAAAVTLEVIDPDLVGQGSITIQVTTSHGDAEALVLPETSPGKFSRPSIMVANQKPVPGNGVVELANSVRLRAQVTDANPGNNLPPTVLTRILVPSGELPQLPDPVPDGFAFNSQQASAGSVVTSNTINVTGINVAVPISVTGGSYSVDGGPFTQAPSTVKNNQSVAVRVVASQTPGATVSASLSIGGVVGMFSVTTTGAPIDTVPDAFSFVPVSGVSPSSIQLSNIVTVSGINAPASVSVSGGEVSIASGAFTSLSGTISNGQTIQLRGQASALANTTTIVGVSVGGVIGNFAITTHQVALDTTPDPFSFPPVTNAPLDTIVTSNPVTITGINAPTPISIAGGLASQFSVNSGPFTNVPSTVSNGDQVRVRASSPGLPNQSATTTLNIGGVVASFTINTNVAIDTTPDIFSFTPRSQAQPATVFTSNVVTITGINAPAPISVTGGSYSVAGSAFTTLPATIQNGQSLELKGTSSDITDGSGVLNVTATIGGVSGSFTITTRDTTPNPISFATTNLSNIVCLTGPPASSATVVISGIDTPSPVSISAGGSYSIAGGAFVTNGGVVSNGQTLQLRRALPSPSSSATVTVTIGQGGPNPGTSASWTITCA